MKRHLAALEADLVEAARAGLLPLVPAARSLAPARAAAAADAMPAKMRIEMPLPRPRSVICSPSHIRNMVPVTRVVTVVMRNISPGSSTSPGCDSSAIEMPVAWNRARNTVP